MKERFATIDDTELDRQIGATVGHNTNLGYRAVRARLLSQGTLVQQRRVREAMHRVDPVGVAMSFVHLLLLNPITPPQASNLYSVIFVTKYLK